MNAVSLNRADQMWSETDRALYHQLPIYMTQYQVEHLKIYSRWPKLLKPVKWEANMGNLMRGVRKEPSPVLRGQFLPQPMKLVPQKDVIETREVDEDVQLYRHDFESNLFHFLPSFQDFLSTHVDYTQKDINEKIQMGLDLFYRTAIFHASPYVWVCGKPSGTELTAMPHWTSEVITLAKDINQLQQLTVDVTKPLNLKTVHKIGTVLYNDIGAVPYSGNVLPEGTDGKAFAHKYGLLTSSEVWDYFSMDPFRLENKDHNVNVINDTFEGRLFGRFTSMAERFEMRIAADGTVPAPQTIEENVDRYNYGETIPNPDWVNAPIGVAFAIGSEAYKNVNIGPPPKNWNGMTMKEFSRLDWNGKVDITRNVLIPSRNAAGAEVFDTNKRGEYLQMIASLAMGIMPVQRRHIIPIVYLRTRISTD
jgi:hypothetical protein